MAAASLCAALAATSESARAVDAIDCDTGLPAATMRLFDGHDHLRVASTAEGEAALATLAAQDLEAFLRERDSR